jgi:hypothetical protein
VVSPVGFQRGDATASVSASGRTTKTRVRGNEERAIIRPRKGASHERDVLTQQEVPPCTPRGRSRRRSYPRYC